MKNIDHVAVAVPDLERALRFWSEVLGLRVEGFETIESEGVKIAMLPVGTGKIELLEPLGADTHVARRIETSGPGLHHVTLETGDLEKVLERVHAAGVRTLGEAPRDGAGGSRVAFLHPRDTGGVLLELVQHARPARPAGGTLVPGDPVLVYLRDPPEKLWGVLRALDASGATVEAIDLSSFEDWLAQVERGDQDQVGPSTLFLPMTRVEKLMLDRGTGELESLSERFERRVGRSLREILG